MDGEVGGIAVKSVISIFIITLTLLIPTSSSRAAVINIPADYSSIQQGLDYASEGDTVLVASGTYSGTGNYGIQFYGKGITLMSEGGPDSTVIDCEFTGSGFKFINGEDSTSIVEGFSITNGYTYEGGGIYCEDSSPTIRNCIIYGNEAIALDGGGIYCYHSSPEISDCVIYGNTAIYSGGGIFCYNSSNPVISRCTITGNHAQRNGGAICINYSEPVISDCTMTDNSVYYRGGAIRCNSSDARIEDCTIQNNHSGDDGGGICCHYSSSPSILNCIITGNSSTYGGGIDCYDSSSPVIKGCIISQNRAEKFGGGINCDYYSVPSITNCTISENGTYSKGGGISCQYASSAVVKYSTFTLNSASSGGGIYCSTYAYPTLKNCIMWDDLPEEIYSASGTLDITYSDVEGGWTGEGNISSDPLFLSDLDFHLTPGSPCIDSGSNSGVPTDIDGDRRPQAGGYDMGSDEFIPGLLNVYFEDNPPCTERDTIYAFTAGVTNTDGGGVLFDEVVMSVTGPASTSEILYSGEPLVIYPDQSISTTIEQFVPGNIPEGTYSITISIYSEGVELDSSTFPLEVAESCG